MGQIADYEPRRRRGYGTLGKVKRIPWKFKKANKYRRYLGQGVWSQWHLDQEKKNISGEIGLDSLGNKTGEDSGSNPDSSTSV